MGWTAAPSRRRDRVSRALLLTILLMQALLSLRLRNAVSPDEALLLNTGRQYLDRMREGTAITETDTASSYLHPMVAAAIDGLAGPAGARLFSLLCLLGATAALYSLARRLFNERVALFTAASFAVVEPTLFLGNFVSPDPPAIFMLALAGRLAARLDRSPAWHVLLVAPAAALAVLISPTAVLLLPAVVLLAVLVAGRGHGPGRSLGWGAGLVAVLGATLAAAAVGVGMPVAPDPAATGTDAPQTVLRTAASLGGLLFLLAVLGTIFYTHRDRMGEAPILPDERPSPSRAWRLALGTVLSGAALAVPGYALLQHTSADLHRQLGYGLLLAAPMAGVGIARIIGPHFRNLQLGIAAWIALLLFGMAQSERFYYEWMDYRPVADALRPLVGPQGRYLSPSPELPAYYLGSRTEREQWADPQELTYTDRRGRTLQGTAAFLAAVRERHFDIVVLGGLTAPDPRQRAAVVTGRRYYMAVEIPFSVGSRSGRYEIWVKQDTGPPARSPS